MSTHIPSSHESTWPVAVAPIAEQIPNVVSPAARTIVAVGRGVASLVRSGLEGVAGSTYPAAVDALQEYQVLNTTDKNPSPAVLEAQLYGMRKDWWKDVREGVKTTRDTLVGSALIEVPPRPHYGEALDALKNDIYSTEADAYDLFRHRRAKWREQYGALHAARAVSVVRRAGRNVMSIAYAQVDNGKMTKEK